MAFESPAIDPCMKHGFTQKLLTFLAGSAAGIKAKSHKTLCNQNFWELSQSGGFEQNSVSIALKPSQVDGPAHANDVRGSISSAFEAYLAPHAFRHALYNRQSKP